MKGRNVHAKGTAIYVVQSSMDKRKYCGLTHISSLTEVSY
mgnify:CR=1 FL=1